MQMGRSGRTLVFSLWLMLATAALAGCSFGGASQSSSSEPTTTRERDLQIKLETPTTEASPTVTSEDSELPDGWTRTQVRGDVLATPERNGGVSFTIDLPPGWEAGETWPGANGARGWIAGPVHREDGARAFLTYGIGDGFKYDVDQMSADGKHDITFPVIEGEEAILHLAKPFAVDLGPQVGIYFKHIPGTPSGADTPSLSIEGDSRGFEPELLGKVLTSVRYTEFAPALQNIPQPEVVTGHGWVRTPARTDFYTFTMLLPPGWEFVELQGIDTLVGQLTNGEVVLYYDFGGFAGIPYSPQYVVRDGGHTIPHLMWAEEIGRDKFFLVKPESDEPDDRGVTGVFTTLKTNLSFSGVGLDGEQQEIVLAMFRTLEPEEGYPGRKQP